MLDPSAHLIWVHHSPEFGGYWMLEVLEERLNWAKMRLSFALLIHLISLALCLAHAPQLVLKCKGPRH